MLWNSVLDDGGGKRVGVRAISKYEDPPLPHNPSPPAEPCFCKDASGCKRGERGDRPPFRLLFSCLPDPWGSIKLCSAAAPGVSAREASSGPGGEFSIIRCGVLCRSAIGQEAEFAE